MKFTGCNPHRYYQNQGFHQDLDPGASQGSIDIATCLYKHPNFINDNATYQWEKQQTETIKWCEEKACQSLSIAHDHLILSCATYSYKQSFRAMFWIAALYLVRHTNTRPAGPKHRSAGLYWTLSCCGNYWHNSVPRRRRLSCICWHWSGLVSCLVGIYILASSSIITGCINNWCSPFACKSKALVYTAAE